MNLFLVIAPYQGVFFGLALGLLVGIERGWSRRQAPDGGRVAGIRTFALLGMAGGVAGQLSRAHSGTSMIIIGACAAVMVAGYLRGSQSRKDVSATSAVVGILTLAMGFAAGTDHASLACVLAALTTLVLASRRQLHTWIGGLTEDEVQALARFALITLAILPVLPDEGMGPLNAWNPRRIWLIIVLVTGFSFTGYIIAKRFGTGRGLVLSAMAGALVSSTAVTVGLANRLRHAPMTPDPLAAGIVAASAVGYLRLLVLSAVLIPSIFPIIAVLVAPSAAIAIGWAAAVIWRGQKVVPQPPVIEPLRHPFDLVPAIALAALVAVLSLAARWVQHTLGESGLAGMLALAGTIDADSPIITLRGLPEAILPSQTKGLVVVAAMVGNTALKAALTAGIAGWRAGKPAVFPLLTCGINALMLSIVGWTSGLL